MMMMMMMKVVVVVVMMMIRVRVRVRIMIRVRVRVRVGDHLGEAGRDGKGRGVDEEEREWNQKRWNRPFFSFKNRRNRPFFFFLQNLDRLFFSEHISFRFFSFCCSRCWSKIGLELLIRGMGSGCPEFQPVMSILDIWYSVFLF